MNKNGFEDRSEDRRVRKSKKALEEADGYCGFAFQGGEPTLAGLPFFERLLEFQKYTTKEDSRGQQHPDQWIRSVRGLGPFSGRGKVPGGPVSGRDQGNPRRFSCKPAGGRQLCGGMRTAELFDRFGVEYNILTVVNGKTGLRAARIYDF